MTLLLRIFQIIAVSTIVLNAICFANDIACGCNLDHVICDNVTRTCRTDESCTRIMLINMINKTVERDEQACTVQLADDSKCNSHEVLGSTHINYWYCCRGVDLCNTNNDTVQDIIKELERETNISATSSATPVPTVSTTVTEKNNAHVVVIVCLIVVLLVVIVALVISIAVGLMCRKHRYKTRRVSDLSSFDDPNGTLTSMSGSGAGVHQLESRTIARQIQLVRSIGKGRYGEVSLGKWQSQYVAVKIFSTVDEQSWKREGMIYRTCMLNNENILRFIAMDSRDTGVWTQLWMVFDYHPRGSLYDFLSRNLIDKEQLCKLTISLVSGLEYLHHDFKAGELHKPSIAHRDLKSRNILVKVNSTCCIADFGLAVSNDTSKDMVEITSNTKQGTKRYMAPEVLDGTIDATQFTSFKLADMYSLGLVLWETTRRCEVSGGAEEYMLPYANRVPHDPSIEEMKKLVAIEEYRPLIPNHWLSDEELSAVAKIMQECWYCDPFARLTALRVKKSLQAIWNKGSSDWKQAIPADTHINF